MFRHDQDLSLNTPCRPNSSSSSNPSSLHLQFVLHILLDYLLVVSASLFLRPQPQFNITPPWLQQLQLSAHSQSGGNPRLGSVNLP